MNGFLKKLIGSALGFFASLGIISGDGSTIGNFSVNSTKYLRRSDISDDGKLYLEHSKSLYSDLEKVQLTHRSHRSHSSHRSHRSHSSHRSHYSSSTSRTTSSHGSSSSSSSSSSGSDNNLNDAPIAYDGKVNVSEDLPKVFRIDAYDNNNDSLNYSIVSKPSHGEIKISGHTVTYSPGKDYFGQDSFTFKVNDGEVDSNIATVSINVRPVNDLPVAASQQLSTARNTQRPITLTATDVDREELRYEIEQKPKHGILEGKGPDMIYTPNKDFVGKDHFSFIAKDNRTKSKPAFIHISINKENRPPLASNDEIETKENTSKTIILKATDPEGNEMYYVVTSQPKNGRLTGEMGKPNLVYHPKPGFSGNDQFSFRVSDGSLNSNTATITISVRKKSE